MHLSQPNNSRCSHIAQYNHYNHHLHYCNFLIIINKSFTEIGTNIIIIISSLEKHILFGWMSNHVHNCLQLSLQKKSQQCNSSGFHELLYKPFTKSPQLRCKLPVHVIRVGNHNIAIGIVFSRDIFHIGRKCQVACGGCTL